MTINIWIVSILVYLIGVALITHKMINSPTMKEEDDFLINQKDKTNDSSRKTS